MISVRRVTLVVIICFVSSCTKRVEIPRVDYQTVNSGKGVYLIRTRDGRAVETDRFKTTETGFVIESVFEDGKRRSVEPYEIGFQQIAVMYRLGINMRPLYIGVLAIGTMLVLVNVISGRLE